MQAPDVISPSVGMLKTQPVSALHYQKYRISPEHGIRSRDEIDHRVEDVLRDVGLWDEVKSRLKASASLSGGQQRLP